jgi:hypothetical protein
MQFGRLDIPENGPPRPRIWGVPHFWQP